MLIWWECHNKIPQIWWFKQDKFIFSEYLWSEFQYQLKFQILYSPFPCLHIFWCNFYLWTSCVRLFSSIFFMILLFYFLSFYMTHLGIEKIYAWVYEKAMVPYSSTLAWKIPWMEEPGRLQSMGSLRVGHDWATSLSVFTFIHWRRKWQPTPAFLPGESQGQGSLVGCRLLGCTESDMPEAT